MHHWIPVFPVHHILHQEFFRNCQSFQQKKVKIFGSFVDFRSDYIDNCIVTANFDFRVFEYTILQYTFYNWTYSVTSVLTFMWCIIVETKQFFFLVQKNNFNSIKKMCCYIHVSFSYRMPRQLLYRLAICVILNFFSYCKAIVLFYSHLCNSFE